MAAADDWDLFAVVRSCTGTTTKPAAVTFPDNTFHPCNPSSFPPYGGDQQVFQTFYAPPTITPPPPPPPNVPMVPMGDQHLHGVFNRFPTLVRTRPPPPHRPRPRPQPNVAASTFVSPRGEPLIAHLPPAPYWQQQQLMMKPHLPSSSSVPADSPPTTGRSRKRKDNKEAVPVTICLLPEKEISMDIWSWRKYGKKPIKGTPHPRGYYRCSTTKACEARKLVERSSFDPGMYTVTYVREHNHPPPFRSTSGTRGRRNKSRSSSSSPPPGKQPCAGADSRTAGGDVDGEGGGAPAAAHDDDDDIFAGLDELASLDADECFAMFPDFL